jgi:hypothetical protein
MVGSFKDFEMGEMKFPESKIGDVTRPRTHQKFRCRR